MNELFTADPECFTHSAELRYVLDKFGPEAGRYFGQYPSDWVDRIQQAYATLPPIEAARFVQCVRRALERLQIVPCHALPYDSRCSWEDNAVGLLSGDKRAFHGVIAKSGREHPLVFDVASFDISPTAEEKVAASPDEFVRVAETLIRHSSEVFLVDPYANPCRRAVFSVLEALLKHARRGRCQRVVIAARFDNVVGQGMNTREEVKECLERLHPSVNNRRTLEYVLYDDTGSGHRMHGRYLFSIKGGIRFDQGFQVLPRDRKVDVGPMSQAVLDEVISTYLEARHDMKEMMRFRL